MDSRWSIAIHGGAGTILRENLSEAQVAEYQDSLAAALGAGAKLLAEGGSALDAAVAAVALLEDDPLFNAGRGATFTFDGGIELDAAVMDGRGRTAGAVAAVTSVRNPVLLARAVMERGPHVFLGGAGAERFAREHGFAEIDPVWFETPERRRQFEEFSARGGDWCRQRGRCWWPRGGCGRPCGGTARRILGSARRRSQFTSRAVDRIDGRAGGRIE